MSKLANPCTKTEIINRLATNESSNQIAKDYNVTSQRIRQIKKENQEKINEIASKLVQENLPDVYETVRNDVQTMKRIAEKAKENIEKVTDKEMQYKKDNNRTNENIFRSVGVFPAQAPSFMFQQNIDNRQQTAIISDNVLDMFAAHAKTLISNGEEDEENLQDS